MRGEGEGRERGRDERGEVLSWSMQYQMPTGVHYG